MSGADLRELVVEAADAGARLDQFLAVRAPDFTRSQLKRRIEAGEVTINGAPARVAAKLKLGDVVRFAPAAAVEVGLVAEELPLEVLHQDPHLIVVNKPAGMVVHPAAGHAAGTLVNALLHICTDLAGVGGELRPGIVHRLDKDTSGVMVAAKDEATHHALTQLFQARELERVYVAVVAPAPRGASGTYTTLHGRHPKDRKRFTSKVTVGKPAVTHWKVIERFDTRAAVVECRLETGRTHQIRVHLAEHGHPVVGDPLYGRAGVAAVRALGAELGRQALHARSLGFVHPVTGERLSFTTEIPADMQRLLTGLRAG